jgi:hypothetical protein
MKIIQVEFLPNAHEYIGFPGSVILKEGDIFNVKTYDSYLKVLKWECEETPRVGSRFF